MLHGFGLHRIAAIDTLPQRAERKFQSRISKVLLLNCSLH